MHSLRIAAPAKLNFFLHITGRRPDGYHLIESLAGFAQFGDIIEISVAQTLSLSVEGPFAEALTGNGANNLIVRAAHSLNKHTGGQRGAHIRLHKNIPIGAGLGGGSSDAAVALKGLAQFWQLAIKENDLHTLAVSLGSDVLVCLMQKPSWISGIGEQVYAVDMVVGGWVVLVNPGVPLLTADVYRQFSGDFSPVSEPPQSIKSFDALVKFMQSRHNALEAPAMTLQPIISEILAVLRATTGCAVARMSGSGATCFALYDNEQQARGAAQHMERTRPVWWVQVTKLLE